MRSALPAATRSLAERCEGFTRGAGRLAELRCVLGVLGVTGFCFSLSVRLFDGDRRQVVNPARRAFVVRYYQLIRTIFRQRLPVFSICHNNLIGVKIRIDLGERQRHGVSIRPSGNHTSNHLRTTKFVAQRSANFSQQRRQWHAGISFISVAVAIANFYRYVRQRPKIGARQNHMGVRFRN